MRFTDRRIRMSKEQMMASCEHNRRIGAYHDGELGAQERGQLEEHIRGCPSCARELEQLRCLSGLLAAAELPQMSPDAMERLHEGVGAAGEVFVLRTAERLTAVAAALLAVCGIWLWQTAGGRDAGAEGVEAWEIAAVSPQTGALAEAGADEMLVRWVVSDLARENGSD